MFVLINSSEFILVTFLFVCFGIVSVFHLFFDISCFCFRFFLILYIHSFLYTVYNELAVWAQDPGPSGKGAAHCCSFISTTETNTGKTVSYSDVFI